MYKVDQTRSPHLFWRVISYDDGIFPQTVLWTYENMINRILDRQMDPKLKRTATVKLKYIKRRNLTTCTNDQYKVQISIPSILKAEATIYFLEFDEHSLYCAVDRTDVVNCTYNIHNDDISIEVRPLLG